MDKLRKGPESEAVARMTFRTILLACCVGLAVPAIAAPPSVKDGVEAWQKGDHAAAVAIWRNLAQKGDADAKR